MKNIFYLFGQLTDEDVDWLSAAGKVISMEPGTPLIKEGVEIDTVYIVLEGLLAVSNKRQGFLAEIGSGEVVGEMSMIDARPPSATVETKERTRVLSVPRAVLIPRLERDTGLAARFYRALAMTLSDRLRDYRGGTGDDDEIDELNPELLDTMHLAGARFNRMLKKAIG